MPMSFGHIVAIIMVGGLVAGCGEGGDGNAGIDSNADAVQIRAVAEGFTSAALSGDYEKACSLTTRQAKAALESASPSAGKNGGGCAGVLESVFDFYDDATKAKLRSYEVTSVQITGDTAAYTDNAGNRSRARKLGGRWLIDSDSPEK
jgi:hypothetical protein